MRGRSLLLAAVGLAVHTAGHGALFAAPGAGVRLTAIIASAASPDKQAALRIEASAPVPYTASRPDPFTVQVDLADVSTAGYVTRGLDTAGSSPIRSIDVEQVRGVEGESIARVRVSLTDPVAHRVRSDHHAVVLELDAAAVLSDAGATTISTEVSARDATLLQGVTVSPDGTSIVLSGNGRLQPARVQTTAAGQTRLYLDFPGVTPAVAPATAVGRGGIERVRVGLNRRSPAMTRVVVDLERDLPHVVEASGPDGRDVRIGFGSASAPTGQQGPRPRPADTAQAPAPPEAPEAARQPAAVAEAQPAPTVQPLTSPQSPQAKRYTGQPTSFDFQGADLRAVLRTFAEISGLNIVIDPAVQGSVDVAMRDVPWDQALEHILRANKLGYSVDGTIVRVAPLTVLADEEKQRRQLSEAQALSGEIRVSTITLSYATAEEVKTLLVKSALSQRGTVEVDPRTNTLIISDLQAGLDKAAALLATLDRPQPQVEIEARIVQTTRDFARSLGVQWGFNGRMAQDLANTLPIAFPNQGSVTGRTGGFQGPVNSPTPTGVNLGVPAATSAIGLALGAVNGSFNLDVVLSALERSGNGKVLSTPRVSTQNNVEAEIMQGLQIPIQTVANNTVTVTFKEAALQLRVTPQITNAGTVIMRIIVENSAPDFSRSVKDIPPIDTQRATTRVLVGDGETTVIGGIYINRQQAIEDRTPGLHRVPLLGWLFKRQGIQDESRELLIFITPRIIRL